MEDRVCKTIKSVTLWASKFTCGGPSVGPSVSCCPDLVDGGTISGAFIFAERLPSACLRLEYVLI